MGSGLMRHRPMDRYPVDDIRDKTNCELHQSMKNISMKVEVDFALPCEPGVPWHGREIRDGYDHVEVDEVVPRYEYLDLDIPRPEEETTFGEVLGGLAVRNKKDIVFPGSVPRRPPSPPSRRNSPPPSTPLYDDRDNYHSPSPSLSPPLL
jgi:hypothetical protein